MAIRNSLGIKETRIATGFALAMTMTDSVILNGTKCSEESFLDSSLTLRMTHDDGLPRRGYALLAMTRGKKSVFYILKLFSSSGVLFLDFITKSIYYVM